MTEITFWICDGHLIPWRVSPDLLGIENNPWVRFWIAQYKATCQVSNPAIPPEGRRQTVRPATREASINILISSLISGMEAERAAVKWAIKLLGHEAHPHRQPGLGGYRASAKQKRRV